MDHLAAAAAAVLLALLILPLASTWFWVFELPAHFRMHIAVAAALLVVFGLLRRRFDIVSVALVPCAGAWFFVAAVAVSEQPDGDTISILSQNLGYRNRHAEPMASVLQSRAADIVILQEFTPDWQRSLAGVAEAYDHVVALPRQDGFGIAVFSNLRISGSEVLAFGELQTPAIVIDVVEKRYTGKLVAVHLPAPMNSGLTIDRNRQYLELAEYVKELDVPYIVVGDFNNTPTAPSLRRFVRAIDAHMAAPIYLPTWPSSLGAAGIPIDLAMGDRRVRLSRRELLPHVHSDHRGLLFRAAASAAVVVPIESATSGSK